ncbi:hypothetical protein MNY58_11850 [Staphylococcus edaphicus]|nr:hypothetical protein [Staphylococcus edaphicus]UQW81259.1 hypothetical protein MNY58_11850 [Staphylococcus edaphicus]
MNINILGFNIFAKGGTSRSNINLVKSFLNKGHKIKYFNAQDFKKTDVTSLIIHEDLNNEDFSTLKFNGVDEISNADLLIITRESFF